MRRPKRALRTPAPATPAPKTPLSVVISSGHGAKISGAIGYLNEHDEAVRVVDRTAEYLRAAGVEVTTYEDTISTSQDENLNRLVSFHNAQPPHDYDISTHFNAFNGQAHGTEVFFITQEELANDVSAAIAAAGHFTNREGKDGSGLYFLAHTIAPAILTEVCFCDNMSDSALYTEHFDDICRSFAEAVSGQTISGLPPPDRPERPERPERPDRPERPPPPDRPDRPDPPEPPAQPLPRPTLRQGDEGVAVAYMQSMLPHGFDGDFGPNTHQEVCDFQRTRDLPVTGVVDDETWAALEANAPPVMPALPTSSIAAIMVIASASEIASYNWRDRGVAPVGFTTGMAVAYAQSYLRLKDGHPALLDMARADTHDDEHDALSWFRSNYTAIGLSNEVPGENVLTNLYTMLLGLGMRESSGQHCCGRDQSASNVTSDTCEAGAFQTSYNSHVCSSDFDPLMDEYTAGTVAGLVEVFKQGVSCSSSDWSNYGSGRGAAFQDLCKRAPAFAVESCGLVLRNLKDHYGPVVRKELELKIEAAHMFRAVRAYVDSVVGSAMT